MVIRVMEITVNKSDDEFHMKLPVKVNKNVLKENKCKYVRLKAN